MAFIDAQCEAVAFLLGDKFNRRRPRLPRQVACVLLEIVRLPCEERLAVPEERMRWLLRGVGIFLPRPRHRLRRATIGAFRREILHARHPRLLGKPRLLHLPTQRKAIDSANKGIDGIWEGRALSRPFYMAATERGPPNISTPFVAETIMHAAAIKSIACFFMTVFLFPIWQSATPRYILSMPMHCIRIHFHKYFINYFDEN